MERTIWDEINENQDALEQALRTLKANGIAAAEAERDYRIAKSKAILSLKAKGYPVTLIPDIVKGLSDVAELDLKRHIAEVTYRANLEAININKKKSDDLRMIFEKEWSGNK